MGFRIEKALPEDSQVLAEITVECSTSPRITLEFKNCKREDYLAWNVKRIQAELAGCARHPQEAVALKAVDEETSEIAGYAVWGWSARASNLINEDKVDLPIPQGTNLSLRQAFISKLKNLEHEHSPEAPYYELCQLRASPRFQRRGLGSQLVKYGLEKADRDGVLCYLSASPMGAPVYRKLGFGEVDRLEVDLSQFGGEGSHVHVAMIRKPVNSL